MATTPSCDPGADCTTVIEKIVEKPVYLNGEKRIAELEETVRKLTEELTEARRIRKEVSDAKETLAKVEKALDGKEANDLK